MITMKVKCISVLALALKGEVGLSEVAEKTGMNSWDVQRHMGILRQQNIISSKSESVRLLENEQVQLLIELSKELDVEKILHESNEIVLSYMVDPITKEDLITESGLSRATVYRALKDFKELGITKKIFSVVSHNEIIYTKIKLNDDFQSVIKFAKFLKKERKKMEEST